MLKKARRRWKKRFSLKPKKDFQTMAGELGRREAQKEVPIKGYLSHNKVTESELMVWTVLLHS
jgi:sulfate adenylyltransferase subunit 1 (EFTu-like GTPase family)